MRVPESLPEEKRFDMMMLALILLINLVEQCDDNKQLLIESKAPSSIENIFDGKSNYICKLYYLFYEYYFVLFSHELNISYYYLICYIFNMLI